ncbi:N-acetylglucosamine-6-phosphate deacetylase [Moorella sp. Hama-1]|uniref:N-acetylglucosamine-6-phosphate deacetylase n=1 Tax=Moorella sp. Hama-1 TaxID=2138101 RepID=UPI000D643AFA|nr:N-acetylglucosamine-6-phosphate deacetylase [Moorella sp. Hama-1]
MTATTFSLQGGTIVLPDRLLPGGTLTISGSKIAALAGPGAGREGATIGTPGNAAGNGDLAGPAGVPPGVTIDVSGRYICPGFLDLHVHGGGGHGFDWQQPWAEWAQVTRFHARHGVTGLLATVPAPHGEWHLLEAFRRETAGRPWRGSTILGLHLEGPYLSPARRGCWPESSLRLLRPDQCRTLTEAAGPALKIITLAPELPGALECINLLAAAGVAVAIGHTDATYDQAVQAARAGACRVTHLYNAMRGLHHREPGAVGAALDLPEVTVEMICDGVHVHPAALRLAWRAKGSDGINLVTDASPLAGSTGRQPKVQFGQFPVQIVDGACRTPDGALAGSLLTLDRAVANAVRLLDVPVWEAVRMASLVPARSLGIDDRKGTLASGKDADIAVLDGDIQVEATFIAGRPAYIAPGAAARYQDLLR